MPEYEVLGIGAPIIDLILRVDHAHLEKISAGKHGMQVVDYPTLKKIIAESGVSPTRTAGGSGANTIRGLAHLGHKTAFLGRIGSDLEGRFFLKTIKSVQISPLLLESETPTAQVVCLVTPDGERTMRAFLGASAEFTEKDLKPEFFKGVSLVHIEGYQLLKGETVLHAMEMAKAANARVSFDLGSYELVEDFKDTIVKLVTKYVDVLFANQQEIQGLTKMPPEKGCALLTDLCETSVVMLGSEGCIVGRGEEQTRFPAFKVPVIDTTGAGDLFASGFLHGYLKGRSMKECARLGALSGAAAVQVHGTDLSLDMWEAIAREMERG